MLESPDLGSDSTAKLILGYEWPDLDFERPGLEFESPDFRLIKAGYTGGQEQCWRRSLGHLGRSCMRKKPKNAEKVKRGPTNRQTDIAGCRVA